MDDWIFVSLPVAAAVHILEEYVCPGGFAKAFDALLPRAKHLFTVNFHIAVNGVFFLLCIIGACIGRASLILSLSVFGLMAANAVLHIRGAILRRGYYPGVISGAFIYIPLAVYAYAHFLAAGKLAWWQALLSFLLGVLYMGSLVIFVLARQRPDAETE